MKKVILATLITLAVTSLAVWASFLVPVPHGNNPFDFYFNLTFAIATPLFSIGASVMIVMGFGTFTKQFKQAYTIMFTGLIIWGLGYLQLPLMVILNQLSNNLFISFTVVPFIGSVMLIFTGTRMLAKLFNVKSITTRWWFAFGVVIAVSILTAILPHAHTQDDELNFDLANSLIMAASTFFAICAYNILLIKRQASVAYTNAFAWLCLSMFVTAFVGGYGSTLVALIFGSAASQLINIIAIAPSCIGAALFLRSAYSFNQIAESGDVEGQLVARDFFGNPLRPKAKDRATSIDIVVHAATLVSTQAAIDPLLNTVRNITAALQPGAPIHLSSTDEESLKQVYLKIEEYLLGKEAVRKFTKEGLRHDIAKRLGLTPESTNTFWNKLTLS